MEVTADSHNQFLAFRRFTYSLSKQLSKDETQAIVYIYFFEQKEALKGASTLEILCKLESSGIITSSNPEKFLELMKDLKRLDLVSEVKDFLKKRKNSKKGSSLNKQLTATALENAAENEEDLILRNTLEAALVQATVLLQQMEMLQKSVSGSRVRRDKIQATVTEAAQTCEALAERLRSAEVKVNASHQAGSSQEQRPRRWSDQSSSLTDSGDPALGYVNALHTDRFAKLMSGPSNSSTNSLSRFYHTNGNSGNSGGPAAIPELNKALKDIAKEEQGRKEESDEEDDYEPMNPGVVAAAASLQKWEESRKSLLRDDYGTSASRSAENSPLSPVRYSMVVKPPQKESIGKRNSTPVNYRPVVIHPKPANPARTGLMTAISELPGTRTSPRKASHALSSSSHTLSSHTYTPPALRSAHQGSKTDDNYTSFHPTAKQRQLDDSKVPHYYKHLDRNSVSQPDVYTAVQHRDSY